MRLSRTGSWRGGRMGIDLLLISATCAIRGQLTKSARALLPGLLGVLIVAPAGAGDIYVAPDGQDTNPGTFTLPFKTIGKASEEATPGTTIRVAPGVYHEILETSASGTAEARIRYISSVPWQAKIRTDGPDDHWSWTNLGSYVDIEGFEVSGNGVGGIDNLGSNVEISGNYVHDIPALGCPGDGGAGIETSEYTALNSSITGNLVHDIGEFPNACRRVHGIYHSHRGGRVVNNIVYRTSGWGIHLWHAPYGLTIANNLVFNNASGGIVVGAGDGPYYSDRSKPADDIMVLNNIVYDNRGIGIEESGVTGLNNTYANNLVFANEQDWDLNNDLTPSGTVAAPPGFVRYDPDGKGNYHLTAGSPAIDQGTPMEAPVIDYNLAPRPQGRGVDIGPFEFVP
jgi:Right handed beta helix region/Protein of unknown function (DUF1565)